LEVNVLHERLLENFRERAMDFHSLYVVKSQQLALIGPVDWDFEGGAHQPLGGELRRVLAVTMAVTMSGASKGRRKRREM
jgi:hypothetical protein